MPFDPEDIGTGASQKTEPIRRLFFERYDEEAGRLPEDERVVTLDEVSQAIREYNREEYDSEDAEEGLSYNNPANFMKDLVRNKATANRSWPRDVFEEGYSARQVTGEGDCFEFVEVDEEQQLPFPMVEPDKDTPTHSLASTGMPATMRRLGRTDESWLVQVLVHLGVVHHHLAILSHREVLELQHLQTNVDLGDAEVDALYLASEGPTALDDGTQEVTGYTLVTLECKGRSDDIDEHQMMRQVEAIFATVDVDFDSVVPMAAKAVDESEVYVVEYEAVSRGDGEDVTELTQAADCMYDLHPAVPGIGG